VKHRRHSPTPPAPGLTSESRDLLEAALEWLGVGSRPGLPDRLAWLAGELAEWAPRLGLSSIRDANLSLVRHVLDSLLLLKAVEQPSLVVDVGSGAGLPGLPLALVWPDTRVVAIDGRRRSSWLVTRLAETLSARNLTHLCLRAESPAVVAEVDQGADLVCAKGLAKVETAVDLCAPLAAPTGEVAILGGPDLDRLPAREGWRVEVVSLPGTDWRRRILVVRGRASARRE